MTKEEAAWEYASKECEKAAFLAGAEWQKKQMLEKAVEGQVSHYSTVHYVKTNEFQLSAKLKQFQNDDKVKIIILKED